MGLVFAEQVVIEGEGLGGLGVLEILGNKGGVHRQAPLLVEDNAFG